MAVMAAVCQSLIEMVEVSDNSDLSEHLKSFATNAASNSCNLSHVYFKMSLTLSPSLDQTENIKLHQNNNSELLFKNSLPIEDETINNLLLFISTH
jgi:hypothetical protein